MAQSRSRRVGEYKPCGYNRRVSVRYRGRLAPSPTGRIHFGTARTALIAWLRARSRGGQLVLRMEDLDGPRVVPNAAEAMLDDLGWLGLDWDEGPDRGGPHAPYVQSGRSALYDAALARLVADGQCFECSCSRRELQASSSAPHGELGPRYPGTCRNGPVHPERPRALRFRMEAGEPFVDALCGPQPASAGDDFVVRRADGLYAYQLAVVVDDIAMGISEVVRGDDLLSSTPRQLALYQALGAEPPRFAHVPLVLGPDGERLAKRHGASAIADFRAAGWSAERMIGALCHSLGWTVPGEELSARECLLRFADAPIPRAATVFALNP
jgi:glutamyl-tRNA synthetase